MRMSTEGLMALIGHEGIVLSRYKDSVGVWTIGVGHTAAAGHPDPAKVAGEMTVSEVIGLLRHDIRKYEDGVTRAVTVPLKQHEFDALVSFHYNTGAIARASFVKSLNAGDRADAMKKIMDWKKPAEIIPRRTAERDLFRTGKYPAPYATIYPATTAGAVQWGKGRRVYLPDLLKAAPQTVPAPSTPAPATLLRRGDRGPAVAQLIRDLHALGYYRGDLDDVFGPATETAVRAFQRANRLTVDGIAGPQTLGAIEGAKVAAANRPARLISAALVDAAADELPPPALP